MAITYGKRKVKRHSGRHAPSSDAGGELESPFSPEKNQQQQQRVVVESGGSGNTYNASLFVESPNKPRWSPHFSPVKDKSDAGVRDSVKRKLDFKVLQPEKEKKEIPVSSTVSDWDFLNSDGLDDVKYRPRKLLRDDSNVSVGDSAKSPPSDPVEELELVKFLKRESQSRDESSQETDRSDEIKNSQAAILQSPIKREKKTYGVRRSYLVANEQEEEENQSSPDSESEESTATMEQETSSPTKGSLKSITQLRLHGKNAKWKDDLDFMIDEIENATTEARVSHSLLLFSLGLFDADFLEVFRNNMTVNQVNSLQDKLNLDNELHLYLWGFTICKVTEATHFISEDDTSLVKSLAGQLIKIDHRWPKIKLTKGTSELFTDFRNRLGKYSFKFFGLTLLLQNQSALDTDLVITLAEIISDPTPALSEKEFQISLILIEPKLREVFDNHDNQKVELLIDALLKEPFKSSASLTLTLKTLISLISDHSHYSIRDPSLISNFLKSTLINIENDEITSLYIGLFINLYDNEAIKSQVQSSANMNLLYEVYQKIGRDSLPYLSLLIAELYTSGGSMQVNQVFHRNELNEIKLQLEKFDGHGNKGIQSKIKQILSSF